MDPGKLFLMAISYTLTPCLLFNVLQASNGQALWSDMTPYDIMCYFQG